MAIGPQSSSPLPGTTKDRASKQSNDRSAAARSLANGTEKERRYGDLNDQASSRDSLAADAGKPAIDSADIDPNGEPAEMKTPKQPRQKPRSLAETRGANWGLSPSARASNPITRPIHIVCEGDRLLVHPEQPSDSAVVVPLRQRTDDSVDQLVSEVQKRIEHWGLAGRGLYWRPQLILEVGHSGEGRYADLEALLADSGFDVKRR
jgi:hypothetical protein